MGTHDAWTYLVSLGVHHRTWDDPLFAQGQSVCCPLRKIPCIDLDDEDFHHSRIETKCSVAGCNKRFSTVAEHASHHRTCHSHVCCTCKQSLPSHHLLDLHILEAHDTLFQVMAAKQPMYQCLLETCSEKFNTPAERKTHCIDSHKFPADFRFDMAWRKLGKNKKSGMMNHNEMTMEFEEAGCEAAVDKRESENISGKGVNAFVCNRKTVANKVPNCVSFGVGVPRGFIRGNRSKRGQRKGGANHWHQRMSPSNSLKTNIEEVSMKDLEEALCSESVIP
ncbi:zinc finger protein 511 [Procambarus clarkii]|uniref:zinc finger protein 511 n=1 Tax=Procambarus clarkii TaxID=6728 RepID=UPI001E675FCA|nr:zinc finger protein 511-like [Procambarus clarkii]